MYYNGHMGKLLTTQEAADILGIKPGSVRKLIERGRLGADKRGRDWLIPEENLEAIKDRKRGKPVPGD
jgi:excisionase family DNA binding protein